MTISKIKASFALIACIGLTACKSGSTDVPSQSGVDMREVASLDGKEPATLAEQDAYNGIPSSLIRELSNDQVKFNATDCTLHFPVSSGKNYCSLLVAGDGAILMDCAGDASAIINYIKECDIRRLMICLTDYSDTHTSAFVEVVKEYFPIIERVIVPPRMDDGCADIRNVLSEYNVPVSLCVDGFEYTVADEMTLTCYYPFSNAPARALDTRQAYRICAFGKELLFLGELTEKEQKTIDSKFADTTDVVVIAGSGSSACTSANTLSKINATYAVVPNTLSSTSRNAKDTLASRVSKTLFLENEGGLIFTIKDGALSLHAYVPSQDEDLAYQLETETEPVQKDVRVYISNGSYHTDLNCKKVSLSDVTEKWLSEVGEIPACPKCAGK